MIIFPHIVKTGGSTISQHLKTHLKERYTENRINGKGIDFVQGHDVYYGMYEGHYMTILRDPAEWLVSMYNQDRSRVKYDTPFEDWMKHASINTVTPVSGNRNRMTGYCCRILRAKGIEEAVKKLDTFDFIGVTNEIDLWFPRLCEYLGVPTEYKNHRVSGQHDPIDNIEIKKFYTLTDDMRQEVYRDNPNDYTLWLWAKQRYRRFKAQGLDFGRFFI
jgi:hypothetical protein